METSAKDGNNVNKLFCEAGKILYNDYEQKNNINKVSILFSFYGYLLFFF